MNGPVVDVYFDYVSNFSWYLAHRLDFGDAFAGARLTWKPIHLEGLSHYADGMPYSPQKRRYVVLDGIRSQAFHGIPTRLPDPFPMRSTERARRVALATQESGHFAGFHRAVFHAAWAEQRDIADDAVLADCLRVAGVAVPATLLARADDDAIALRARGLLAEAEARGVFGVPTLALRDELFWGNDRLDVLRWRLASEAADADRLGRRHQFHGVQPVLPVADVAASVAHYRDVLGFDVDFVEGQPPIHARVCMGDGSFGHPVYVHLTAAEAPVRPCGETRLHVGYDLDGLFSAYADSGVEVVFAPVSQPWGLREFAVRDLDGHVLRFGAEG